MRKFILLDHSLRDTGGHHFPYAASVLQAAEAAGFAPALATHSDFTDAAAFPPRWPHHALFPAVSYSFNTLDTQAASASMHGLPWHCLGPLYSLWRNLRRRRHIEQFAAACAALFRRLPLSAGDIVFLPTVSELDLHGLAAFMATAPPLPAVQWHAQLHFGIQRDRDWRRHGDTRAMEAMRASLRASLQGCAGQRLRLWCTTEPLAEQYQALGVADFAVLPYPVHPFFSEFRQWRPRPQPARISCLGHARREKNQGGLPALLQSLWTDVFAPGRAQLVVQNARAALRDALQSRLRQLAAALPAAAGTVPLDCSAGKLEQGHYAQLVCGSDIGLLLYDARRYHDRCSGVLLEMLVAAVPVVVPARSWLSEQIAAVNQGWLQECAAGLQAAGRLQPLAQAGSGELPLPEASSGLMLHMEFPADTTAGVVDLIQHHAPGRAIARQQLWLEPPRGRQDCRLLVPLSPGCRAVTLRADGLLAVAVVSGPLPPLGAIGIAIDDSSAAAGALRDILDHIEHYKQRAALHAVRCAGECSSARIIERLLERA